MCHMEMFVLLSFLENDYLHARHTSVFSKLFYQISHLALLLYARYAAHTKDALIRLNLCLCTCAKAYCPLVVIG